jgi:hypothetical protein
MSPSAGRFLSPDPIQFEGSEWNLFEYVDSQSTRKVDPYGFDGWIPFPPAPGGAPGCINPMTGKPCGVEPEPATPELICTAVGTTVVCFLVFTPIPGDEAIGAGVFAKCLRTCKNIKAAKDLKARIAALQQQVRDLANRIKFWEHIRDNCQRGSEGFMQALRQIERLEAEQESLLGQLENLLLELAKLCL